MIRTTGNDIYLSAVMQVSIKSTGRDDLHSTAHQTYSVVRRGFISRHITGTHEIGPKPRKQGVMRKASHFLFQTKKSRHNSSRVILETANGPLEETCGDVLHCPWAAEPLRRSFRPLGSLINVGGGHGPRGRSGDIHGRCHRHAPGLRISDLTSMSKG